LARGGDHVRQLCKPAVAGSGVTGRVSGHFHPLIPVVNGLGFVLLKAEADVVYRGGLAWQYFHRSDPGVALEWSWKGDQFPLQDLFWGDVVRRQFHDDLRLHVPAAFGPLNRRGRSLWVTF